VYVATATLRIDKDEPRVLTFDEVVKQTDPLPDSLQTHQRLLQGRTLANRVIQLLSLGTHPDFQDEVEAPSWIDRARAWARKRLALWLPHSPVSDPALTRDLTFESPLTRVFQNRLSVDPVRGSRLVAVSFESRDPVLAARVANTLGDTFVVQTHELRADTGRYASRFLSKQMAEAGAKLEAAEQKLNAFLKANGINFLGPASLAGRGGAERQDLITQQLATLSDSLLKARSERIAKESLVVQAKRPDPEALPAVLQSPLIVKLKGDLATLEASYQQLAQTFKPEYPRMQQLRQSITETRAQVRAEVRRIVKSLETDHRAALQNERAIERAMDRQRKEALKLGDQMVAYGILRREVDTGRELYTALLTRLKETQISADLLTSPISIVDRAEVPLLPARPRKALALLLASVAGLLGGIGVACAFERLDRRIAKVDEVERLLGVPKLGLVPNARSLAHTYTQRHRLGLATHLASASQFAEFVRDLRTSILYSTAGRPPRTFMVTSPEPGDGKTSVSLNLAVALAQLGSGEVLLVDGDLRHPELHTILNVRRTPGLSTFLAGRAELSAALTPTEVPNLSLIPAGQNPWNPGELLASRRLDKALKALSERFEYIIFDTAPLFAVSDALNLAPRVDGVVLVLRHGRARRDDAQEAVQRLCSVRANLLGVVMNDVDGAALGRRRAYYSAGQKDGDAEVGAPAAER
jgi:succinoglycan biosynthesis transport protein ExoP